MTLSTVMAGCTSMSMPPSPSITPATKKTPRRPKEDVRVYSAYDRRVRDFLRGKPNDGYPNFDVRAGRWDGFCAFIGASVFFATFPGLTGRRTDERLAFV